MEETPSERETERQYRVLQQTLSAHAALRDAYSAKAKVAEILLLACATVFLSTTFAGQEFYAELGTSPGTGELVLGIASVLAFISSLAILVLDWRGRAARHGEATEKWATALKEFRRLRSGNGSWLEEARAELNAAYWEAARNSTDIPDRSFNRLKARHLRKVKVSKLTSRYPGCSPLTLSLMIRMRDMRRALRSSALEAQEEDEADK